MPYTEIIRSCANLYKLDPLLVQAVVAKESSGNPYAWNPEPRYRYFWDIRKHRPFRTLTDHEVSMKFPPLDFPALAGDSDQEWWAQQASWGLLQVMGAVAREEGFSGPYLPALCDPGLGLDAGCRHLAKQLQWAQGDVAKALSAYNAGRVVSIAGAAYARRVLTIREGLARPV